METNMATHAMEEPRSDACGLTLASALDVMGSWGSAEVARQVTDKRRHARDVVAWVVEHAYEISGHEADWHNLVTSLIAEGDFASASRIADVARERFPHDADLLAAALQCAGELGDWDKGDSLLRLAKNANYRADEDWRLTVQASDYLRERARTEDEQARMRTIEEALAFIDGAINRLPPNDRLLCSKAEMLLFANRIDDATDVLESAIFVADRVAGDAPNIRQIPVAQCCGVYLNQILRDSCDYEKVIDVAEAGIRFAATEQRSFAVEYFLYRKALAMDGQINSDSPVTRSQAFGNQDLVREAMRTYALAFALDARGVYRDVCRDRFMILAAMGGVDDMAIDQYCERHDAQAGVDQLAS